MVCPVFAQNRRHKFIAIFLTVSTFIESSALKCYFCSINDQACLDPFTPDNSTMQHDCPSWANICIKTVERRTKDVSHHVLRACFRDSVEGLDGCTLLRMAARSEGMDIISCETCDTDFCNGFS
ncbi:uncharacterized protein LOC135939456 [Cloeon dipterum]|uniref:uncharacterized protein LOC135939456 n=1 Tax=Cloeon dipterum TaxID=197152 RepID=UPI00321F7E79